MRPGLNCCSVRARENATQVQICRNKVYSIGILSIMLPILILPLLEFERSNAARY
jgi:hypothetical protein